MHKLKLILSSDDSYYINFLPLVSQAWSKFFDISISCIIISDKPKIYFREFEKYANLYIEKPVEGIPKSSQGMTARLWLASLYSAHLCIINDLDLIPLQSDYLNDLIKNKPEYCLLAIGAEDHFKNIEDKGKFPMGYCMGEGRIFSKIVNPKDLSYEDWIKSFIGLKVFDSKEDISKEPPEYSDESLIRALISKSSVNVCHVPLGYKMYVDTIDRYKWNINIDRLYRNDYIDAHMLRPFHNYISELMPLIDYINPKYFNECYHDPI
jgi:hypothetical protein